jgi:hypothetical protein
VDPKRCSIGPSPASRRSFLGGFGLGAAVGVLALPKVAQADDPPAKGMKARVFEVRHQDADQLTRPLEPLLSGAKGAKLSASSSLRTISVRDFPENLAAIEQALRRLDVPTPPRPDIEVRLRILIAAHEGGGDVPEDLQAVVKQLQATLSYKAFYQVTSISQRVRANAGSGGRGEARLAPPVVDEGTTVSYRYGIEQVQIPVVAAGSPQQVQLRRLRFELEGKHLGEAEVSTGVSLREGEKVVVGTGSLKNRAMIVVVSVKVAR